MPYWHTLVLACAHHERCGGGCLDVRVRTLGLRPSSVCCRLLGLWVLGCHPAEVVGCAIIETERAMGSDLLVGSSNVQILQSVSFRYSA